MHGTATALGDPIEAGSLCGSIVPNASVALGSGKANAGHAEPGAGAVGLRGGAAV